MIASWILASVVNAQEVFHRIIRTTENDIERLEPSFVDIAVARHRVDCEHAVGVVEENQVI